MKLDNNNAITAQSIAILQTTHYTDSITRIINKNQFVKINIDTTDTVLNYFK